MARGQQVLREKMKRLEAQLKGVWLGHARQEFEALKVRGSWPWGNQDLDSQSDLISKPSVPQTPQTQLRLLVPWPLCDVTLGKSHVPSHASVALFVNKNNNYVSK